MNYTLEDLVWYSGFILGTSGGYVALGYAGIENHWPKLIAAGCFGVGLGWVSQKMYSESKF